MMSPQTASPVSSEVHTITHADVTCSIEVRTAGEGPPLVYLHGAGGFEWNPFLEALAQHHTLHAPILPDAGESDGLEAIRDIWDMVYYYEDVFDAMGLTEGISLLGHSLGGMFACELAAHNNDRYSRLIALAPAGLYRDEEPLPDFFCMQPDELLELVLSDPESPLADQVFDVPEDDVEAQIEAQMQQYHNLRAAAKFIWPIPDKGLDRRIHRIDQPTLILWGEDDGLIPVSYADDFERAIPQARVERVADASHLLFLEQPEEVLGAVHDFLD